MKLHHYITVALIFLLVPSVLAASFTVETEPIKPEIYIDEIAEFTLSITNNGANDAFEQPSSADVRWIVETDPFIGSISSGETKKVTLRLIPKKSAQLGPQNVPVRIKSDVTGEFISTSVLVTI
ncbi:hypothetical protein CMO92_03915, partial [Candidatus Woesearchaeota archaeon]|nr:hypothetical protein [Candidatus Woesearchaeota archaeon]